MEFEYDSTNDKKIEYNYVEINGKTESIFCPTCGKYLGDKFKDAKGHVKLWCKQDKKEVIIKL